MSGGEPVVSTAAPIDRRFTVVSFHAHPDDEALLTGGLLARTAREGHRVVIVTATEGELGLAGQDDGAGLAETRMRELVESARALGCARVVSLGFADSGLHPDPRDRECFAHQDVEAAAETLAALLREERADVLTVYDPNGGYGHPDHRQVHRVGSRAADLAGTPVVLEATVPGRLFTRVLGILALVGHPLGRSAPLGTSAVFGDPARITHRVRLHHGDLERKRAAMAAHGSQRRGPGRRRVIDRFVALPEPLFRLAFGREWYVEQGRPGPGRLDDVFCTLRMDLEAARALEGRA